MQWRFIFNPVLCIGCRNCELSCRNEFAVFGAERWRLVQKIEPLNKHSQSYYLSLSCNHCENPECFRVCPEKTYRKRRDGIVLHDAKRCGGCGRCVRACPFGAPQFSILIAKVDKCNFCAERIDKGIRPVCIEACPVEALRLLHKWQPDPPGSLSTIPGFENILTTKPAIRFLTQSE